MKTSSLRSLAQAFDIGISRASMPVFLAPTAARADSWGHPKQYTRLVRKHASVPSNKSQMQDDVFSADPDFLPILTSSLRRRDPKSWADLLDQYLPHELRLSTDQLTTRSSDVGKPRSIQSLPRLLFNARTTKPLKLDLLSYVGVYQGRWEAAVWLVKAMLDQCLGSASSADRMTAESIGDTVWLTHEESLEELTFHPIWAEEFTVSPDVGSTLDKVTYAKPSEHWQLAEYMRREGIGQIWQSVGCMILQAADRPNEDETFKTIMFNVFQILGHLHHINALPGTIYNYTPAQDPSVLRRPPTLNLLSSRIMTILSDIAWKIHEREVSSTTSANIMNRPDSGHGMPTASLQPRIRELGPEIWLDLVLWSCVEGGWIMEGAWIVSQMMRRKGDQRWSAVNWHALHKLSVQSNAWSRVKSEIERSRMNQIGRGISIAGPSGGLTSVETIPRTISSEVVVALIDGLVNTTRRTTGLRGTSPAEVQQNLLACKNLLERKHFALDTNSWNAVILRLVESGGFFPEAEPRLLEYIINLIPSYVKEIEASEIEKSPGSSVQGYAADQTSANLGLLHRNLHSFSEQGDVQGALRTFRKLQVLVDANRSRAIQDFALGHQDPAELSMNPAPDVLEGFPGVYPDIPTHVLAAFLDLVTNAKLYGFGRWLLYSDEVDGPTIAPELYFDENIQPALLRFATATADESLLNKITKALEAPISEKVLHGLMHCQVALRKWDAVGDLLAYFQQEEGMRWHGTDVMIIARAVLQIENDTKISTFDKTLSLSKAHALLQGLLQGKYNTARDHSQLPNLSQIQMMNQLRRMLQAVPGSLSEIFTADDQSSRIGTSCGISSRAFNVLLEGVVEAHGSIAGRRLWNRWCREVDSDASRKPLRQAYWSERVVVPNLHMLRTIMRPIAQARYDARGKDASSSKDIPFPNEAHERAEYLPTPDGRSAGQNGRATDDGEPVLENPDGGSDIIQWGVNMYKKFGLTDREINIELPEALSQRETEEDP